MFSSTDDTSDSVFSGLVLAELQAGTAPLSPVPHQNNTPSIVPGSHPAPRALEPCYGNIPLRVLAQIGGDMTFETPLLPLRRHCRDFTPYSQLEDEIKIISFFPLIDSLTLLIPNKLSFILTMVDVILKQGFQTRLLKFVIVIGTEAGESYSEVRNAKYDEEVGKEVGKIND